MAAEQRKSQLRLYIVEQQELYRRLYKDIFPARVPIELLRVSNYEDISTLRHAVSQLHPDVMLFSTKKLGIHIIEKLQEIRKDYPKMGIILLLVSYDAHDVELLRMLMRSSEGGLAVFLKQSLNQDQIEQLCQMIVAVSRGQVVLDPPLAPFMLASKAERPSLRQFTTTELEIMSLLSQGYTNSAIAETLCMDIAIVEHHLHNMYSKIRAEANFNDKHLRLCGEA